MGFDSLSDIAGADSVNILVVRTDRIGDVVLSTPVLASLRASRPNWKISILARPAVAPLLQGHPDVDSVITLETDDKPSFSNTRGLSDRLRKADFDIAVHLYSDFWISLAVWRASVGQRIGPASKLARIFYNHAIVQHRSIGGRHEADHNLDLLKPLGIPPIRRSKVSVAETIPADAGKLLDNQKKNIGIFPAMGGSARNWKPEKYARLAELLSDDGLHVILMCGPGEEKLLDDVQSFTSKTPPRYVADRLDELAVFVKALDCFVAPSTGPLHIASAVGTPAVGIYCPIKVCLPERWGPIGEMDKSFVPDVPVCERCTAERCERYDCMDSLEIGPVAGAVMERI
ncbi:MAG: glycosyltransferase family 9 protein [Nitrospinota bacterium]